MRKNKEESLKRKKKEINARPFPLQYKYSVHSLSDLVCQGLPEINKGPTCISVRWTMSAEKKISALDKVEGRRQKPIEHN